MIPRVLHYVWMGKAEKPYLVKRCVSVFKKQGYDVVEWNEDNFDINAHEFVKVAYEKKKWAFVSDYVRAYVIYNYGGIYLDTDVVIVSKMDELFENECFVGFENDKHPFTAVFGAIKGHPFVKDMLDYYTSLDLQYVFSDNNTISTSDILISRYKCKIGNIEQMLKTNIKVYKAGVLCVPSRKSITVHLFLGSWLREASVATKVRLAIKSHFDNRLLFNLYLLFLRCVRGYSG